jgi:hypothetical protein
MKIFWLNKISNKDLHNITNTKDMETLYDHLYAVLDLDVEMPYAITLDPSQSSTLTIRGRRWNSVYSIWIKSKMMNGV